ncbi:hypothetical protein TNCV_957171 [Trichonephila clavipes]|nr:hypothetical protein TNCV_957171 [Trichonephila clavipes]
MGQLFGLVGGDHILDRLSPNVIPGHSFRKLGISNHLPTGNSGKIALLCHVRHYVMPLLWDDGHPCI